MSENCGGGGKFVLLPKNSENVAAFSKFLCPPRLLGSNFPLLFLSLLPRLVPAASLFGDVFTLPVQLRPPEMGNVAGIGALCRYWEGDFVSGGRKRRADLTCPHLQLFAPVTRSHLEQ